MKSDLPEWQHVGKPNSYAASPNVGRSFFGGSPTLKTSKVSRTFESTHIRSTPLRMKASQECLHLGLLPMAWSHCTSSSVGA